MSYIIDRIQATLQPLAVVVPILFLMSFAATYQYFTEGFGLFPVVVLFFGSLIHAYIFLGMAKLVWKMLYARWNKQELNLIHFNFYAVWYPAMILLWVGMISWGVFLDGRF